jgi:integrase/recombinase XerD
VTALAGCFEVDVESYLDWLRLERGRSANTIAAYRRDLEAYGHYLARRGDSLDSASESTVLGFVADRVGGGAEAATVARALVAVRGFHRFRSIELDSGPDPAVGVASPRVPRVLPKALGEAQVAAILDQAAGSDPISTRDRAVLEVLYGTGMRISEMVGLDLDDLDLDEGLARVTGKGSRERLVPLGDLATSALTGWLSSRNRLRRRSTSVVRADPAAVFWNCRGQRLTRQGAWLVVKKRAEQAGLGPLMSPHVLRHSCATHMLERGADLRVVQELLGHASLASTQIYTRVTAEHLRAVYLASHPRAS